MSQQAVETVVGKAVLEDRFRSTLFNDPDSALSGYELTETESAALRAMDVEALEAFAGTLDQRISKSIPIGVLGDEGRWVDSTTGDQRVVTASAPRGQMQHIPQGT